VSHLVEKHQIAFRPRRADVVQSVCKVVNSVYLPFGSIIINELGDRALGFNRTLRLDPIISICC
jgi:hypothetical protein